MLELKILDCKIYWPFYYFYLGDKIDDWKLGLKNGTFIHKEKLGKKHSEVWLKFHEIFSSDMKDKIDHFHYCMMAM